MAYSTISVLPCPRRPASVVRCVSRVDVYVEVRRVPRFGQLVFGAHLLEAEGMVEAQLAWHRSGMVVDGVEIHSGAAQYYRCGEATTV